MDSNVNGHKSQNYSNFAGFTQLLFDLKIGALCKGKLQKCFTKTLHKT